MSLKNVKAALERLKREADDVGDDGAWNLALMAKAEIAALEKAARDMRFRGGDPVDAANRNAAAWRLFDTIAKGAE